MAQTVLEKAACEKCGVDVRENTTFCYNCGNRVAADTDISFDETIRDLPEGVEDAKPADGIDPKTKAALDSLAEQLKRGEEEDDRLAKAAAERRRSRVAQRKPQVFKWESTVETSNMRMLLASILVAVIAGAIVLLTVVWR